MSVSQLRKSDSRPRLGWIGFTSTAPRLWLDGLCNVTVEVIYLSQDRRLSPCMFIDRSHRHLQLYTNIIVRNSFRSSGRMGVWRLHVFDFGFGIYTPEANPRSPLRMDESVTSSAMAYGLPSKWICTSVHTCCRPEIRESRDRFHAKDSLGTWSSQQCAEAFGQVSMEEV